MPSHFSYETALAGILEDPRYLENLEWGEPRPGHPEGTLRAHVEALEANLEELWPRIGPAGERILRETDRTRLRILIHAHDTFKPQARRGVRITHPESHASLARAFLGEFLPPEDPLLELVQSHDEPYAVWRRLRRRGALDGPPSDERAREPRLDALLARDWEWGLFIAFLVVDGCVPGKTRRPLRWFLDLAWREGLSPLTPGGWLAPLALDA